MKKGIDSNCPVLHLCSVLFIIITITTCQNLLPISLRSGTGGMCPEECSCIQTTSTLSITCRNINSTTSDILKRMSPNVTELSLQFDNPTDDVWMEQLENFRSMLVLDLIGNSFLNESCSFHTPSTNQTVRLTSNITLGDNTIYLCVFSNLPLSLKHLSLHNNLIRCLNLSCLPHNLSTLDVSSNNLSTIHVAHLPQLEALNLSCNVLTQLPGGLLQHLNQLISLDVSKNRLTSLWPEHSTMVMEPNQTTKTTTHIITLRHLNISANQLVLIPANVFMYCSLLKELDMSHIPTLQYLDALAFSGLYNLHTLLLSHNRGLSYIHSGVFQPLVRLRVLDLSFNSLVTLHIELLIPLVSIKHLTVHQNQWDCDCDVLWIQQLNHTNITNAISSTHNITTEQWHRLADVISPSDIVCTSPPEYSNLTLSHAIPFNHTCSNVSITSRRQRTQFHIGSPATLNCDIDGDPTPHITWVTPSGNTIKQDPAYISLHHKSHLYTSIQQQHSKRARIHVLINGSLYINYVERKDVGNYHCTAYNTHGYITIMVPLRLDAIFRHKVNISFGVGLGCALVFMFIGIIVAIIRYIAFKCSQEQREKRKSIRQILAGMSEYRTERYDRFSTYRMAKIDQLSAFKSAKVMKLKNVKNLTVTTLINYLHQTHENYTANIQHIRDNCTQQATHLQENYANQFSKIRGYKADKMEKIRDNYQGQANRIKEYGSSQLEKLRDQYHLQQQHALKILEILNIGNCMNVIESECMRTESLMFDDDLFDMDIIYDKCKISQLQMMGNSDSYSNVSNYQTVGSEADTKKQEKDTSGDKTLNTANHANVKKYKRQKQNGEENDGGESPMSPQVKHHYFRKKKHLHKKSNANSESAKTLCVVLNRDDSIHYLGDTEDVHVDFNCDSSSGPTCNDTVNSGQTREDTMDHTVFIYDIEGKKVQYDDKVGSGEMVPPVSITPITTEEHTLLSESYV